MTQEEKNLVIKDLCGRLPYVQFVYVEWNEPDVDDGEDEPNIHTLTSCNLYGECTLDDGVYNWLIGMNDDIKPYLRPMSSMTDDEKKEFDEIIKSCNNKVFACPEKERRYKFFDAEQEDFMNAHHFDYRGLIPMGLALEAPDGMYK